MNEQVNQTKDLTLYSQKAIGIATFTGGPIAVGYLIHVNYLALDKPDEGKKALLISIIATIALLGVIFLVPENIIEKIPNQLLTLMYLGIIYMIVEKNHGNFKKT